jgi:hypothetical protein
MRVRSYPLLDCVDALTLVACSEGDGGAGLLRLQFSRRPRAQRRWNMETSVHGSASGMRERLDHRATGFDFLKR